MAVQTGWLMSMPKDGRATRRLAAGGPMAARVALQPHEPLIPNVALSIEFALGMLRRR